ncbi:hypothetical protein D0T53_09285 [Dysgonomonas sp. 216]|uniref:hypothetical protein n=1 Tax=Dysgonomonas sp. 216 TaxID=2302934 RepID=UPI0013D019F3|nr:hypothetical protein [Dysgonomonas sp. 216]NDW19105.1 hypothetical protein [Dysgonomonas sp. 216]
MNRIFFLILIAIFFAACSNTSYQKAESASGVKNETSKTEIPYTIAERYFVRNTVNDKLFELKIDSAEEFEKYLGIGTIMGERGKATEIDFSLQSVLAIIVPESQHVTTIDSKELVKEGDQIVFRYIVKRGKEQSFKVRPVLLIIVDKEYSKDVKFYGEEI